MLDNKVLLENIKKLCDNKGIKITNLEKELGFGGGIISRWGNNADPSLSKIIDIADYFHVTLDEVVGRNQTPINENYEFINLIIEQTKNGQLQWCSGHSNEYYELKFKHPENKNVIIVNFNDKPDIHRKIDDFATKCNEGYLIFNSTLVMNNNTIEESEFFFYIQPNDKSEPVYQIYSQEQLLELYKAIKVSVNGLTPEMKAEEFKKQILSENSKSKVFVNKIIQSQMEKMFSENELCRIRKLFSIISQPEMLKALQDIERLSQYLGDNNKRAED